MIGVLSVVNAFGMVIDSYTGEILAGIRDEKTGGFYTIDDIVDRMPSPDPFASNTTLCTVVTDASFSKEEVTKIAQMAQDGLARAIFPAHTMIDGDIVFAMSAGEKDAEVDRVGMVASQLVAQSIAYAVHAPGV